MHEDEYRSAEVLQRQLDDHLLSDPAGLLSRYRGLVARSGEAKKASQRSDDLAKQVTSLTKQGAAQTKQIEILRDRLAIQKHEHDELTEQLAHVRRLYYDLKDQRDGLRGEKNAAQKEARTLNRKVEEAQNATALAETEREEIRTALFETKNDLARERTAIAEARERSDFLRAELERVRGSRSMQIGRTVLWPWHATKRLATGEWPNRHRRDEIEAPQSSSDDVKGTDQ